jgi:cytosine/adenosine deaminase-related metal-dependent hydrolase
MSGELLLRGACVLTLGARTQNHAVADVLIADGAVAEVGTGLRSRSAETIDASNTIVMPGFVDAHRRCWPSLFRNEGGPLADITPSPEDVHAGTLASLLGAAEAGITTVVDWYDGPASDEHVEASLRAHAEAGLRTVLVLAPSSDPEDAWRRTLARHGVQPSPMTTIAAGIPSLAGTGVVASWNAARAMGLRIHTLAGPPERDLFARFGAEGMLGADVTIVHGTGISDGDLDAIAAAGAGFVLTPSSDMTSGPGVPPVQALIDRDIRPGLGVDDELVGPGDVLAQMRATISIQHATYFDLKLAGKGGLPNLLTTRDAIKYGTIDGARAVGLESITGSIEPGKAADLVVIRTDRPNIHPVNDPIGAVVWGMDTSNLDWVLVGGRPAMRGGALEGDIAGARALVNDARTRIGADSGGVSRATVGGMQ